MITGVSLRMGRGAGRRLTCRDHLSRTCRHHDHDGPVESVRGGTQALGTHGELIDEEASHEHGHDLVCWSYPQSRNAVCQTHSGPCGSSEGGTAVGSFPNH